MNEMTKNSNIPLLLWVDLECYLSGHMELVDDDYKIWFCKWKNEKHIVFNLKVKWLELKYTGIIS